MSLQSTIHKTIAGASRRIWGRRAQSVVEGNNAFLRDVTGLIHVGANTGQERDLYAAFGLRVLWIEPIPEIFKVLTTNIAGYPSQKALNCLIGYEDGKEYQLHIANNNGESSSILELSEHRKMWPNVHYTHTLTVSSVTLGTAIGKASVDLNGYDALVLDTQGSEYEILHGAASLLRGFQYIKVEVPDFESYKGCCQIAELSSFMNSHGFHEARRFPFAHQKDLGTYYDVIYASPHRNREGREAAAR